MASVAVVGPGSVGGAVAGHLAASARHELVLCVRTPFEVLVLEAPEGRLEVRPRIATDPGGLAPVDWILLATKAHDTESARPWLAALAGADTSIAVLQNGVEHVARVRPIAGDARIVPVIVACAAERLAPGHVRVRGSSSLTVPDNDGGRRFAALFEGSRFEVRSVDDFTTALWRKLCVNVTGALTALTNQTLGVLRRPDVADLARGLVLETVRVARAEGARLSDELAETLVADLQGGRPDAAPSILQDLRAGRPLEWDARNGAVVRVGARHGIETPLNAAVCALLAALSQSDSGHVTPNA